MMVFLVLLGGCGSCLDDRRVPDVEKGPPKIKAITTTTDAGRRPVLVGDSVRFSSVLSRDGGSNEER